ncbi:MAG TPA: hypothetical protein GX512_03805 [Firmicutes bacterium]|nr:hypothetical protein [Candidatus Fermentithermobacillaceae bacterium]
MSALDLRQVEGGVKDPIQGLYEAVKSGSVSLDRLTDKGRAALLDYSLKTGEISTDSLSKQGRKLLEAHGFLPKSGFFRDLWTSLKGGTGESIAGAGSALQYTAAKMRSSLDNLTEEQKKVMLAQSYRTDVQKAEKEIAEQAERLASVGQKLEGYGTGVAQRNYAEPVEYRGWRSWLDPQWLSRNLARSLPSSLTLRAPSVAIGILSGGLGILGSIGLGGLNRVMESAMEAGQTYREMLNAGRSEDEAIRAADEVFNRNLKLAGLDVAQVALAFGGKIPGVQAIKSAAEATRIGKAAMTAGQLAIEAGSERFEEMKQHQIQTEAMGGQYDPSSPEAREAGAIGALMGLGFGATGVISDAVRSRAIEVQRAAAAKLAEENRAQLNAAILERMSQGKSWPEAASEAMSELSKTNPAIERAVQEARAEVGARYPEQRPAEPGTFAEQEIGRTLPSMPSLEEVRRRAGEYIDSLVYLEIGDRVRVIGEPGEYKVHDMPKAWTVTLRDRQGNTRQVTKDRILADPDVLRQRMSRAGAGTQKASLVESPLLQMGQPSEVIVPVPTPSEVIVPTRTPGEVVIPSGVSLERTTDVTIPESEARPTTQDATPRTASESSVVVSEPISEPTPSDSSKAPEIEAPRAPGEMQIGEQYILPSELGGIRVGLYDPKQVGVDPDRFQFKTTGKGGVTSLLKGVTRWRPDLAGRVLIWEDRQGRPWIVNGHHRLELAQRLNVPVIEAQVIREVDGVTESMARTRGALANIAEGRGDAVDVARFLRETGLGPDDLRAEGISLKEKTAAEGVALSGLTDRLWRSVLDGTISKDLAIVIGRDLPKDVVNQQAVAELLAQLEKQGRRISPTVLEGVIAQVKSAETSVSVQETLFGEDVIVSTSAVEKAEILEYVLKQLRAHRALFNKVSKTAYANLLETAGNVLATEKNLEELTAADMGLELVQQLAYTKGTTISEILNRRAQEMMTAQNKEAVKREAFAEIFSAVKEGKALEESIGGETSAEPVQAGPSLFGETGGAEEAGRPEVQVPPTSRDYGESAGRSAEEARRVAADEAIQAFLGRRPSPRTGQQATQTVRRSDIVKFLSEKLDIPIRTGRFKTYRGKVLGIFKVKPEVIRTRLANDLPVIAHEVGHYLDKVYGLDLPQFNAELMALGQKTSLPSYTADQIRAEGVAEFMRLYLTDPQQAQTQAPNYRAEFENRMSKEVKDILLGARQMIQDWYNQPAAARISASISTDEKARNPFTWDGLYTQVVNELRPLEVATRELTGGQKIPTSQNPYETALRGYGWAGSAETALHYGVMDADFNKIGPSLEEILRPYKDRLEDIRRYIASKRAVELEARGIWSGIGEKGDPQTFIAQHPELEQVHRQLVNWQDLVLRETLLRSGIISRKTYAAMKALNKDYVPFYRVFDETSIMHGLGKKGYANQANPVKRIKGSGRDIIDPLESIIRNVYTYTRIAKMNDVAVKLVELAEQADGGGKWVEKVEAPRYGMKVSLDQIEDALKSIGVNTSGVPTDNLVTVFTPPAFPPGKENIITVFRNGERVYYQVDPDLYPALLALDKSSTDMLVKVLQTPARLLRSGATLAPSFMLKNPLRDQFSAFLFSKYGYKPGIDLARGIFHLFKKDDLYWKWQAAGGAQSALVSMDRDYLQGTLRDLLRTEAQKVGYYASHPLEALRALSEWGESGTRLGEFARGVRFNPTTEGILEAALASREVTVDFARGGTGTKTYRRIVPFFNAQIQGTDRLIRAMRENPKQFAIRAMLGITIPTIIAYLMCRNNNRYKDLEDKEKDLYWHIPMGPNPDAELVRIPKPHEAGILFGSFVERILQYIDQEDPTALDGFLESALSEMLPNLVPQFFVGYFEAQANKKFYSGLPIIPAHEQDLPPEMQYGPYTGETARWLGEKLRVSPRMIEHYVSSYGGGLASTTLDAVDWFARLLTDIDTVPRPDMGASSIPVLGSFVTSPTQSKTLDEFYTTLDRLEKEMKRQKAGKSKMSQEDRALYHRLKLANTQISAINKRRRQLEEADMPSEKKGEEIQKLYRKAVEIASKALRK